VAGEVPTTRSTGLTSRHHGARPQVVGEPAEVGPYVSGCADEQNRLDVTGTVHRTAERLHEPGRSAGGDDHDGPIVARFGEPLGDGFCEDLPGSALRFGEHAGGCAVLTAARSPLTRPRGRDRGRPAVAPPTIEHRATTLFASPLYVEYVAPPRADRQPGPSPSRCGRHTGCDSKAASVGCSYAATRRARVRLRSSAVATSSRRSGKRWP
jgi:hypothetical protein